MSEVIVNPTHNHAIPVGYKHTEIGVIPEDWDLLTLDDVCRFVGGAQPEKKHFSYKLKNDYVRLIQIRDYKSDKDIVFIPEKLARKKCNKHDIMIGRYGPPIFQILRGIEGAYNVALIKAIPDTDRIEREFLFHFLKSEKLFELMDMLSQRSSGQTGVELPALKSYPIALPPKQEQTAIANALSDVDALLAELEKLIAKKQAIKTATMQQLLTGKTRLPQFATYTDGERKGQPKGMKSSELGEIPEDWEVQKLERLISFRNGSAHENCIDYSGQYVVVNSKFISTEGSIRKNSRECRQPAFKGDVLLVMSDVPNGKAIAKCYFVEEDEKYTVNQRICALTSEHVNPKYLFYILNRHSYYLSFDDGVKQTNLRRQDVLDCPLLIPRIEEQEAIATILSHMDNEIRSLEQRLEKTRQIKQGMMQELLTGRTRLPFDAASKGEE